MIFELESLKSKNPSRPDRFLDVKRTKVCQSFQSPFLIAQKKLHHATKI